MINALKRSKTNTAMVLWDGTIQLTRCPSPIWPWCAAWRPSCGHGWGCRPAPASSGPGFHSSRAKAGGTNPPRSSVERRAGEGGIQTSEKHRDAFKGGDWKEIDKNGGRRVKLNNVRSRSSPPIKQRKRRIRHLEEEADGEMDLCKLASVSCCSSQ